MKSLEQLQNLVDELRGCSSFQLMQRTGQVIDAVDLLVEVIGQHGQQLRDLNQSLTAILESPNHGKEKTDRAT